MAPLENAGRLWHPRTAVEPVITPTTRRISLACIGTLLLGFALVSWLAVRTKSATADEPLHLVAAFARVHENDFRLNPEDPPLVGYWAMAPHSRRSLVIDKTNPAWHDTIGYMWSQWEIVVPALYRTEGVDAEAVLARSRMMMLLIGIALGAAVAWFAWLLGGPFAAIVATALYVACPNFLGHAPLVKNDVPLSLVMLALALAVWRAGERLTIYNLVAIALATGAAVTVKFSGLLLAPVLALLLLVRIVQRRPWLVFGRIEVGVIRQSAIALGILLVSGLSAYTMIWVSYGLRFAPTPDPELRLNLPLIARAAARNQLINESGGTIDPTPAQILDADANRNLFVRSIFVLDEHKMLPEAWLAGLLDTYATTLRRPSFLLGEYGASGWWSYFPLAVLFKTPLGTLVAIALAWAFALWRRVRGDELHRLDRWAFACFAIPIGVYGASALVSNLNLGLRHVLPLYPLAFVLTGVTLASFREIMPRAGMVIAVALISATLIETAARFPNYIAFFNVAAGGPRGGLRLLGDSNLDWGQDLKLLAQWQKQHPDVPLYLSYFGGADPGYYVKYRLLPRVARGATPPSTGPSAGELSGVVPFVPALEPPEPGVLAVSATELQGIYLPEAARPFFFELARREPIDVLGGTIYLYDYPARKNATTRTSTP